MNKTQTKITKTIKQSQNKLKPLRLQLFFFNKEAK